MCGIVGFTHQVHPDAALETLSNMLFPIRHRGPDGLGTFTDNRLALGHARLAIIDLTGGKQPRRDSISGDALVFNGEIYGYKKLADYLISKGASLADHSDTEVLFQFLERDALERVLDRIDGMYAFAYYRGNTGELFLVRDRFGEKPLFYGVAGGQIVFGSEISAIRKHPSFKGVGLDRNAIGQYLALQFLPGESSGFEGIRKIPPGHFLRFHGGHVALHKYWQPSINCQPSSPPDRADKLEYLLSESVRERLVADVPVGIFLSGGLDSSLIAALAAQHQPDVRAFSIGMDDKSHDESPYAEMVAKHLGLPHQITHFTNNDLEQACDKVLCLIDEPLADASLLPTYLLCQAARASVKVALGGDGADELFAGYPNFVARRFAPAMALLPNITGTALRYLFDIIPQNPDYMGLGFKLKQLSYGFGHPADYQSHQWMSAFSDGEQSRLWAEQAAPERPAGGLREDTMRSLSELRELSGSERLQHLFLTGYLAEDILQKVDRASMYNGLEVRTPFLSRSFAEFALALPFQDKLRGQHSKFALKEIASRMLPPSIIRRPKHGFAPPLARLIRTVLRQRMEGLLFDMQSPLDHWFRKSEIRRYWEEHQSGRRDHHRKLWTLAILILVSSRV